MGEHTPGPWETCGNSVRTKITDTNREGFTIADCCLHREERKANAHLIAAAPDLLTALEQVLDMGLNGHDDMLLAAKRGFELTTGDIRGSEAAVIAARAAIKKARGE